MNNAFSGASLSNFYLDPRTKLIFMLMLNIVLIGGSLTGISALVRPFFALVPFILLLLEKKQSLAGVYGIFISLAVLCELFLVSRTSGALNLVVIIFSGLLSRFIPGLVMGFYMVNTTKISEFIAAMERMHLPNMIIIPFVVMIRFFPTVNEERAAIKDAMCMRGIRFGGGSLTAMLEYRLVPLMVSVVKIGEELSAAALTRGLGSPVKRTNICQIGFCAADVFLLTLSTAAFAAWCIF